MAPVEAESTWEKYETFLNSFHPEVKKLIRKLERVKDKWRISKSFGLFNVKI